MASILRKLGSSSKQEAVEVYMFEPSKEDKNIIHVRMGDAPPIYTVKLSTKKDPDVFVWRGSDTSEKHAAMATIDKPTMTANLMVQDLTLPMKTNKDWGSAKVEHPQYGLLRWKTGLQGNPSTLSDGEENELAKHKTVGMHVTGGPRELKMLVEADEDMMLVVVSTLIVARRLSGIAMERNANLMYGITS
ncbi:hypothetical protein AMS68_003788 [Peltaster fructicola]|uniref:Uncharacterized protein n=1 Tax=Peltaster fructicola TaxID=286661 RepID=A0A6H0XUC7_9PEZI|nr:hypothetical protein AMS68_003788 [Peltaster fructicola]